MKILTVKHGVGWTRNRDDSRIYHFSIYTDDGEQQISMTESEWQQLKEIVKNSTD